MKLTSYSFLIPFLLSLSGTLFAQDVARVLDQAYGLDQTLCNGKKYLYLAPAGTRQNQYLVSPDYVPGNVTVKGKIYPDLTLNYDIFNQQLLLKYNDGTGIPKILEVSKAWLTTFSLGSRKFEFLNIENNPRFFQVLGDGPARVLYFWRKTIDLESTVGVVNYYFSHAIREPYVLKDGQLSPFRSKRSFIRIFPPEHKTEIRDYLRKNKVKIRKAGDKAMADLVNYICTLN